MANVERLETAIGDFSVETEVYTGPLELLINLIEKRKLLINDISLATVTDDYMRHVALLEQNPLKETTQFVLLASTLLLIKSKSLLPILDLSDDEEESIESLELRLRLYQVFRNASKGIASVFGVRMQYRKQYRQDETPLFTTDKYTEVDALKGAINDVLSRLPKKVSKPKVKVRKTVSLEEMIDRLKVRIERQLRFRFEDFAGSGEEKTTVIVGFLAVLEMVKQGSVIVKQSVRFHDIEIERESKNTPNYT